MYQSKNQFQESNSEAILDNIFVLADKRPRQLSRTLIEIGQTTSCYLMFFRASMKTLALQTGFLCYIKVNTLNSNMKILTVAGFFFFHIISKEKGKKERFNVLVSFYLFQKRFLTVFNGFF